jgi:hypothetical protein
VDREIVSPAIKFSAREVRLLTFWNTKRAGRPMPRREDFVAEELQEWIGWMHLLRPVDGGDDFVYEVFSTRSPIGSQREMTGRRVGEWDDQRVEAALAFYRTVMREKSPISFAAPERFHDDFMAYRRLALPFGDDTGVTHILAHLSKTTMEGVPNIEPIAIDLKTIAEILDQLSNHPDHGRRLDL